MQLPYFVFHNPATTQIYTLSLHDALPISVGPLNCVTSEKYCIGVRGTLRNNRRVSRSAFRRVSPTWPARGPVRSEEHTSELQSHHDLVCRLLLEKKKKMATLHFAGSP